MNEIIKEESYYTFYISNSIMIKRSIEIEYNLKDESATISDKEEGAIIAYCDLERTYWDGVVTYECVNYIYVDGFRLNKYDNKLYFDTKLKV